MWFSCHNLNTFVYIHHWKYLICVCVLWVYGYYHEHMQLQEYCQIETIYATHGVVGMKFNNTTSDKVTTNTF